MKRIYEISLHQFERFSVSGKLYQQRSSYIDLYFIAVKYKTSVIWT